jgi:peptidoglycan/xylan/chitin deacetylase (PgdA/CDA1 family)
MPEPRQRWHRWRPFGLLAVVLAVAAVIVFTIPADSSQTVAVNGRQVRTPRRATVAAALKAAKVRAPAGTVYSAVSHRVLGNDGLPPRILLDDAPANLDAPLHPGDRIEASPGADSIEAVVTRHGPGSGAGLPDVEHQLWRLATPSDELVVLGERSGEVVQHQGPSTPPTPARPETDKVVALSFDDGPDPHWTPQVLKILHDEGVPAMFCLVGTAVRRHPEVVAAELAQGATLCDHTVHHDVHLDQAPHDRVVTEVNEGADIVREASGVAPAFYRPPAGKLSPDVVAVAHQRGLRVLTWSVDPADYTRPPANVLLARIMSKVGPGAIILLHDGGGDRSQTVALLPPLIQALRADGYRFAAPAVS